MRKPNPEIIRWDDKYRAASASDHLRADELLVSHAGLLSGSGRALDIACGAGASAIHVAALGYETLGLDGSSEGLRIATQRAAERGVELQLQQVDLTTYRPPRAAFDLVLVFRYLDRSLFGALEHALRPGGLLFYKTFNRNLLHSRPSFNAEFLLEPGELEIGRASCRERV